MTPIKDISGFNRDLQSIEIEDKIRRVKSKKSHRTQNSKKGADPSGSFNNSSKSIALRILSAFPLITSSNSSNLSR